MSNFNDIQILLDIQDKNLEFERSGVKEGTYKGKPCKYVTGKLTYTPTSCEACGTKNENYTVYKNGTQCSRITLPFTGVQPTVQREIDEAAKLFKPLHQALPKHLSFDEFKHAKGAMAFEYINVVNGDILDILERRDKLTIKNHFITNYGLANRKQVETVIIDINARIRMCDSRAISLGSLGSID